MAFLIPALLAVVAWIAATVVLGVGGFITGALIAVVAMFVFIIGLTSGGVFSSRGGSSH